MRLVCGADHAGAALKGAIAARLRASGHDVVEVGASTSDPVDYPDPAAEAAAAVSEGRADRAILVCGTGIGMGMVANRFRGVRAAVAHDRLTAEMSRRHNDANVLCLGARVLD
ncbi:MAG: RpiB/LacA/LacB family sugar-phosphate isomerase, partial [Planctomycetales bacterium]|nr:RpiB/LacA/LacB family sugar-phosphate isomerase [Planctomycetales bacterium]